MGKPKATSEKPEKRADILTFFFILLLFGCTTTEAEQASAAYNNSTHNVLESNVTIFDPTTDIIFNAEVDAALDDKQKLSTKNRTLRDVNGYWIPHSYCTEEFNNHYKGQCGVYYSSSTSSNLKNIGQNECLWCSTDNANCDYWDGTQGKDGGTRTDINDCYWTGYSIGGCPSAYEEVDSDWSITGNSEKCCRKVDTYRCCDVKTCTASSNFVSRNCLDKDDPPSPLSTASCFVYSNNPDSITFNSKGNLALGVNFEVNGKDSILHGSKFYCCAETGFYCSYSATLDECPKYTAFGQWTPSAPPPPPSPPPPSPPPSSDSIPSTYGDCECTCCKGNYCSASSVGFFNAGSSSSCSKDACRTQFPSSCPASGSSGSTVSSYSSSSDSSSTNSFRLSSPATPLTGLLGLISASVVAFMLV